MQAAVVQWLRAHLKVLGGTLKYPRPCALNRQVLQVDEILLLSRADRRFSERDELAMCMVHGAYIVWCKTRVAPNSVAALYAMNSSQI